MVAKSVRPTARQSSAGSGSPGNGEVASVGSGFRPNWDVVGVAATAVTVVGASIFFIAGWVYESHWYGFYGIDISQTSIYPAMAMVEGVPGIFVFLVSFTLAWVLWHVSQAVVGRLRKTGTGQIDPEHAEAGKKQGSKLAPLGAGLLTYGLMTVAMVVFNFGMIQRHPNAYETPLVAFYSFFIGLAIVILATNAQMLATISEMPSVAIPLRLQAILRRGLGDPGQTAVSGTRLSITPFIGVGFLTVFSFMLVFITSISTSALLGVYDAIHAQRSLSSWKMPIVYIVTSSRADVLQMISSDFVFFPDGTEQSAAEPAYGPFGLIHSDDQKYYLVWLAGDYEISDIKIPDPFQVQTISGEARKRIAAQWHNGVFVSRPIVLTVDRNGTNLISASVFLHSVQP